MNEFKQDYENEKHKFYTTKFLHVPVIPANKIEFLFSLANLLRARFEVEMMRGATTEEYIEMIKIASSFINNKN